MPPDIGLRRNLPFLMTRPVYEIMLISWVASRTAIGAQFKIKTAVEEFMNYYNIQEDEWGLKSAIAFVYDKENCDKCMCKEKLTNTIEKWNKTPKSE